MDITERKITKIAREAEKLKASKAEIEASFYAYLTDTLTREEAVAFAVVLDKLYTVSYVCAAWMKKPVQQAGAAYKKAAGALSAATLDRAQNAVTYRICGCESAREAHQLLRRGLFAGGAAERRGGGRRHAAFRLRQGGDTGPVRHVGRHLRDGHQLYHPHLRPHRKPRHGDTNHPVGHGGRQAHRRVSEPAGARRPSGGRKARTGRCGAIPCDLRLRRKTRSPRLLHDRKAGRAGDAGGPDGRREKHGVQAAAGAVPAAGRLHHHRRCGCRHHPGRERRSCIGCVEQHFSRVPGTVLEQITLSDPSITTEMAENAAKLAGIDATIRALPEGYATVCTDGMFSRSSSKAAPSPDASSTAAVRSGITSMAILDRASRFLMVMPISPHNKHFAAIIPQTAPQC